MNKETIEEAAVKYRDLKLPDDLYDAFIAGAKWQQERVHSVIREAFRMSHKSARHSSYSDTTEQEDFNKWFEQFNKI